MSAGEQEGIISIVAVLLVVIDCMMRYPLSTSLDVYNVIVLGMNHFIIFQLLFFNNCYVSISRIFPLSRFKNWHMVLLKVLLILAP